ncbi:MAG: B12-binding domain-containing radical SAM protein [Desulfobacula sp.]|nr:B12-binding domain-containing radical SAM protein [Desulfobacula sp.]
MSSLLIDHILLLTPPLNESVRFGNLTGAGAIMPGIGILSLAACLRKLRFSVSLLDAEGNGLNLNETVQKIIQKRPKILGITSTTLSIHAAANVAAAVKSEFSDILIVLGGPHVTALSMETMEAFKSIDAIITGDGELSFTKLVENIFLGEKIYKDVDGVFWREGDLILSNPKTKILSDLDSLAFPAWDLLDGFPKIYRPPFHSYRRLPVGNIITSRGCPGVCSFCDRSVFGQKTYRHSNEYVVEMISYLVKDFGIREISIKDDMFIHSTEHIVEFCQLLEKKNIKVSWSCNARVISVNDEMLRIMKKAGCWMISYGVESGSPQMLKKMMKGATTKQALKALQLTRKNGITSKGFFMVGIPGETQDTIQETLDFIKILPLDEITINFFTPFPGSKLYEEVLNEGFKPDFEHMSMQEVIYVPKAISRDTLEKTMAKIIYKFYLRPVKISLYFFRAMKNYYEFLRILRMGNVFVKIIASSLKNKITEKKLLK